MRGSLRRTLLLLAGAALLGAACGDGGSPTGAAPGGDEARVGFSLNVAGTSVSTISVEVTAPDITSRLVFNIEAVNGVATGSITIPAGVDRTITARAYDAKGIVTHQGAKVVTVKAGTNTSVTITLVPTAGEQPLTISFGALVVQVARATPPPSYPGAPVGAETGDTVRYRAVIRNADGTAVSGTVRWASLNPAIATVDSTGLVTARRPGQAEIAATYQGAGGTALFTVRGDGTDGTADQTGPALAGLTLGADSLKIAAGDTALTVTLRATDAGVGVSYMYVYLVSPLLRSQSLGCTASSPQPGTGPTNQVSWSCTIPFSRYAAAGTWTVGDVQLYDRAGNHRGVTAGQVAALGGRTRVEVVNPNQDITEPVVTGISIAPDSINLATAADTTVNVTVSAEDPGAGIDAINVGFRTATGVYGPYCIANGRSLPAGTSTRQVTWSCRITLPRATAAGTYTLGSATVYDLAGNVKNMTAEQIAAAGWESTFKVVK